MVRTISENTDKYYGIFETGGSIGDNREGFYKYCGRDKGKLIKIFTDNEEAKNFVKQRRSRLSPGERKYYGYNYYVKPLSNTDLKNDFVQSMISDLTESIRNINETVDNSELQNMDWGELVDVIEDSLYYLKQWLEDNYDGDDEWVKNTIQDLCRSFKKFDNEYNW